MERELRATVLPLVIVLVFAVCGTVSLLGFVLDAVYAAAVDEFPRCRCRGRSLRCTVAVHEFPRWLQQFSAVANVLVIFNSDTASISHFLSGSQHLLPEGRSAANPPAAVDSVT